MQTISVLLVLGVSAVAMTTPVALAVIVSCKRSPLLAMMGGIIPP